MLIKDIGAINAGAYIRVSTDEQAESGYSLQAQRERITAQIQAKGWVLHDIYEDAGQSGGTLQRPQLQRLLSDIDNGKIQAVVVYKLDRLSRKQIDTISLIENVFVKKGVKLVSISESLDTGSSTGLAMIGMLSVFAQLERDTITERLSSGRLQKAKTGGFCGGSAPIGYKTERNSKVLYVDAEKAKTVQRVFMLSEQGLTQQAIADILNAEGHTTKRGVQFGNSQISRILRRKGTYNGTYSYSGVTAKGQHQAII